jgi:protein-disulfide isomerase
MNQGAKAAMIGLLGVLAGAGATVMATGAMPSKGPDAPSTMDKAAIEKIVREYILNHPEILPEAMQNLQRKEASNRVKQQGPKVEQAFGSAWEGAANGDVTLVEFFDYACGYCRASRPDIDRLLAEDKGIKVVYRELPILGQPSDDAARVSLAVAKLGGNYGVFHRSMFGSGRPSLATIDAALKVAGVDAKSARSLSSGPDIAKEIKDNLALQQSLGLSGTPSWVIGDQLIGGAVGYDELKSAIAEVRAAAKGRQ